LFDDAFDHVEIKYIYWKSSITKKAVWSNGKSDDKETSLID
jgi:hypothetical protein